MNLTPTVADDSAAGEVTPSSVSSVRSRRSRRFRLRGSGGPGLRAGALPYLLVMPLVAAVGVFAVYPTALTTVGAFYEVDPLYPRHFVGLQNFRGVFTDPTTRISLINTLVYAAVGVAGATILGLAVAITLRRRFRSRGLILACVVLPWAVPSVVGAVIWGWIFDPNFGVLNGALTSAHILNHYYVWLGLHRFLTVVLIEVVQIWQIAPISALIILAALQSIPAQLYEAALVDGAGPWRTFRRVTIPLIRPALALSCVQALVLSLNIFDQVYVLNYDATSGSSLMLKTYVDTFSDLNFGQGYALSLTATLLTVVFTVTLLGLIYRRVSY